MSVLFAVALSLPLSLPQIGGDGSAGPFTPSGNTTLDTTANGGVFQFSTIVIPPQVSVRLTGPNPAVLRSQGAVDVSGTIDADGEWRHYTDPRGGQGGAGGFAGGDGGWQSFWAGEDGDGPGGGRGGRWVNQAVNAEGGGSASHSTPGISSAICAAVGPGGIYGAGYPFDLRGGSGGGGGAEVGVGGFGGAGGGGALAILADGAVTISGAVHARGGDVWCPFGSGTHHTMGGAGSGGSVLVRSMVSVTVTGTVDATGGWHDPFSHIAKLGGDGFVRFDAYATYPVVTGTVTPAPDTLELPHLRELVPPRLGGTWMLSSASTPGDVVALFLGLAPAYIPIPPHGVLELDPTQAVWFLGVVNLPLSGVDPTAVMNIPVPPNPALIGTILFVQAANSVYAVNGRPFASNSVRTRVLP